MQRKSLIVNIKYCVGHPNSLKPVSLKPTLHMLKSK